MILPHSLVCIIAHLGLKSTNYFERSEKLSYALFLRDFWIFSEISLFDVV
jgi:hypothetical protein